MTQLPQPSSPLAPCIVDVGTIIQKRDMLRLLADLGRVYYVDLLDGQVNRQGEGYVMEVYRDPDAATMIVNRSLYVNVNSFDYLMIDILNNQDSQDYPEACSVFDLVQENRILRLIPLSDPLSDPAQMLEDTHALKAAMVDALADHGRISAEEEWPD
ncbi:MAG: hypothetical protein NW237_12625 [Cyanobacteriota bacterium]|nr:hypothetical protein [Cyanobacteriota bacterium]